MTDFTIVIMEECSTLSTGKTFNIGGYKQFATHDHIHNDCTCMAFKFSKGEKNCKHLDEARAKLCSYHEITHGKPTVEGTCPLCGEPTRHIKVGV